MDQGTLKALAQDAGLKLGVQAEFTLANFGRSFSGSVNFSKSAAGRTMSIAYSKGCFGGISIEGALIRTRKAVNEEYYKRSASCFEIIAGAVASPDESKINDVYTKLNMLKKGKKADEHREG
jgi:lipid-binding SYLF domain-containing protein